MDGFYLAVQFADSAQASPWAMLALGSGEFEKPL
jgi:hypothetical protein